MSKHTPTIAVTGAQGFIGGSIVDYFAAKGWQVRALVRRVPDTQHPGVTYVPYDLTQPLKSTTLKGVDYLVHAAYIKSSPSTPNALELNLKGTERLLASARTHRLQRVVFLSSLSAQPDALSAYGKQKYAIERLFDGPEDTVIRPGLVIGNGGLVREMTDFIRTKHIVPLIGGGNQPLQIIGIDELVTGIDTVLSTNLSGDFTLASAQTYPYREFYRLLAKRAGTWALYIPLPFVAAQAILKLSQLAHVPLAITEDNLLGLKQMKRLSTNASLKTVGITIRPLAQTIEQTRFNS